MDLGEKGALQIWIPRKEKKVSKGRGRASHEKKKRGPAIVKGLPVEKKRGGGGEKKKKQPEVARRARKKKKNVLV